MGKAKGQADTGEVKFTGSSDQVTRAAVERSKKSLPYDVTTRVMLSKQNARLTTSSTGVTCVGNGVPPSTGSESLDCVESSISRSSVTVLLFTTAEPGGV